MNPFLALNLPGGPELIIIFIIMLLLFGAKKLPELAKGLGQAVNEFRKAKEDFGKELEAADPNKVVPVAAPDRQPYSAVQTPTVPTASAPISPAPTNPVH